MQYSLTGVTVHAFGWWDDGGDNDDDEFCILFFWDVAVLCYLGTS